MTIYDLKPAFQNLLRPIARWLHSFNVTPNLITLTTMVFIVTYFLLVYLNPNSKIFLALVPIVLFVRMALNAIDGMIANEFNLRSKLGGLLNEVSDVVSDAAMIMAFVSCQQLSKQLLVLMLFLSVLIEFVGVASVLVGSKRGYFGPMGKSDRAFVFGVISLLLAFSNINYNFYFYIFICINFLLVTTVVNRIRRAVA